MSLKGICIVFLIAAIAADSPKDFLLKSLLRTFEMPITLSENIDESLFSLEIMLENDVFTLDDTLRLFIQQFLIAIFNNRIHLIPDDWESRYPAYDRVLNEINNLLDVIAQRPLSQITMKDVRPLIKSLTATAWIDLQRLLRVVDEKAQEEEEEDATTTAAKKNEL